MGRAEALVGLEGVVGPERAVAEAGHLDAEADRREGRLVDAEAVAAAEREDVVPDVLGAHVELLCVVVRVGELAGQRQRVVARADHVVADAQHEGRRRDKVLELVLDHDLALDRLALDGAAGGPVEAEVSDRDADGRARRADVVVDAEVEQRDREREIRRRLARHLGRDAVREEVGERLADRQPPDDAEVAERLAGARGPRELRRDCHLARVERLDVAADRERPDASGHGGVVERHVREVGQRGRHGLRLAASGGERRVPEERRRVVRRGHGRAAEGSAARVDGDLQELEAGRPRPVLAVGRQDLGRRAAEPGGGDEPDEETEAEGESHEGYGVPGTGYSQARGPYRAPRTAYPLRTCSSARPPRGGATGNGPG